ncbi:LuxR C-terminal-related transcriptional regulator [Parasphingorhabdus pacifica]
MKPTDDAVLRPNDADAFRNAVREVRRYAEAPVAFGGQVSDGILSLSEFLGVRTTGLKGLHVRSPKGLGGQVVSCQRPAWVNDYGADLSITHHYDAPVLAEGIRSVIAVPVAVRGSVRGVLYAADRGVEPMGDRVLDVVVDAARRLAVEVSTRDEVDRRLHLLRAAETNDPTGQDSWGIEEVRELHAEFRCIAQGLEEGTLRDRLREACDRLANLTTGHEPKATATTLAPRELDVLSQVALGCSNAEIANRLSLLPETVKAYLRSVMRKLDVRTRHEAVVTARRHGLLP